MEHKLSEEHQIILDFIYEDVRHISENFEPRENVSITSFNNHIKIHEHFTKEVRKDSILTDRLEKLIKYIHKPETTQQVVERELKRLRNLRN